MNIKREIHDGAHHDQEVIRLMRHMRMCLKNNNVGYWQEAANTYEWNSVSPNLLRYIACYLCRHTHGYIIVSVILNLNVLHFEDIEMISFQEKNLSSKMVDMLTEKLHAIAQHYSKPWEQVEVIERNLRISR